MPYIEEERTPGFMCPYLANNEDGMDRCVGAHCMAWRYSTRGATTGYCGIAGKPNS